MNPIPWFQPEVNKREEDRVLAVLKSGYLNDGDVTREFERQVAAYLGAKHCVGVTSGTAAITLSLMGLGVGPGDEVIVPDLTFIATANAVRLAGAQVKLVDVNLGRFDLNRSAFESAISTRTKAVVPVDVNGRGAGYDWLEPICKQRGIRLVCDAAEALGSKYMGRFLGTFGDAGCFSFSANKTVTTGQGGMIATNNSELYHRLLELKDQGRRQQGTGGNDLHPVMGFNFKLTNLQAAVGLAQLEKLDQRLMQARNRDQWYLDLLKNTPGIEFPDYSHEGEVRQWTDVLVPADRRAQIESRFKAAGIGNRPFWYPLHRQVPYSASDETFTNSLDISGRGMWLASSFSLTEIQARRVAEVLLAEF